MVPPKTNFDFQADNSVQMISLSDDQGKVHSFEQPIGILP